MLEKRKMDGEWARGGRRDEEYQLRRLWFSFRRTFPDVIIHLSARRIALCSVWWSVLNTFQLFVIQTKFSIPGFLWVRHNVDNTIQPSKRNDLFPHCTLPRFGHYFFYSLWFLLLLVLHFFLSSLRFALSFPLNSCCLLTGVLCSPTSCMLWCIAARTSSTFKLFSNGISDFAPHSLASFSNFSIVATAFE